MTTETAPDPIIHDWSDDLEQELVEEGMEPPQAKVFARAFELGMNRVLSVMATKEDLLLTKQDLQKSIGDLRSEIRRDMDSLRSELHRDIDNLRSDMDRRFAEVNARFDRMERRFLLWGGGIFGLLVALVVRAFS